MGIGLVGIVIASPWLDADSTALGACALAVAIVLFPIYWFSPKARMSVQRHVFGSRLQEMALQAERPAAELLPVFDSKGPGPDQVDGA